MKNRTPFNIGVSRVLAVLSVAAIMAALSPASAEVQQLTTDAKRAGHAVGSAVREVGQGTKKIGKEIGQGVKDAGRAIGGAAREGGKEFRRAVKGE